MALPPDVRFVTVGTDHRLPPAVVDQLLQDFPRATELNIVGVPSFVILEYDMDATNVPDGTFIARLPEGFVP